MKTSEQRIDHKVYTEYKYRLEHMANCCGMAGQHPKYPDLPCHYRINVSNYVILFGRSSHLNDVGIQFSADGRNFVVPASIFKGI